MEEIKYDKAELFFDVGQKAIFDKLIYRILVMAFHNNFQANEQFIQQAKYIYKFADLLKDNDVIPYIKGLKWEDMRKIWIKVIELIPYIGTYTGYTEILKYIFGENVKLTFESRVSDVIYNESLPSEEYCEWVLFQGEEEQQKVYTKEFEDTTENVKLYLYNENSMKMSFYKSGFEIRNNILKIKEVNLFLINDEGKQMLTEPDEKNIMTNQTPLILYNKTGRSIKYLEDYIVPRHAGNLWINVEVDGDVIRNLLWFINNNSDDIMFYDEVENPLYLTELVNMSQDVVGSILNFLTPTGLRTHFNFINKEEANND